MDETMIMHFGVNTFNGIGFYDGPKNRACLWHPIPSQIPPGCVIS